MIRVDEPFQPEVKSSDLSSQLKFRLAQESDRDAIVDLMVQRHPERPLADIISKTEKELLTLKAASNYLLYVAELNSIAIAYTRFFHSEGLPREKIIYEAPEGWYAMGILVNRNFRRQGVAKFLAKKREEVLRQLGVKVVHSLVDGVNRTSLHMHEAFEFEKIAEAEGFLHIKFDSGSGALFRKNL